MEAIVVSASMGVMKTLMAKLTILMGDKYKKLTKVRKEVSFLKDELSTMSALLKKMDGADELDSLAKNWRNHVRDIAYDIEDCIDDFMHCAGEADDDVGILQKASRCLQTYKDNYRIANQIKEIKTRVIQVSQRQMRYKLNECRSSTTSVAVDPRLSALYKEPSSLVGIHSQKEKLVKWVMDEVQQFKVVSIVGFGGLGKTTLANAVYREVGGQFRCKAFVSVSQKPDMTKLLNNLLSQLGINLPSHCREMEDIINYIREYLLDKRYLFVVDDLWDVPSWDIIRCAFPQNKQHNRVIVTTRIGDVSRACCSDYECIHNMEPLSDKDSRKLFFNRIFGSEHACPSQFTKISSEILKKCGGLPLAIITIASILACQPTRLKEQWEYIQNSLAGDLATNPTLEDMMHILDLSYKNLPHQLKACFLYLGAYPEDHKISKNDLVRQWVAEGFVCKCPGRSAWDIANSYFNELVNRSMIQPAEFYDYGGEILFCRVHDMMLDLILRRCREENFICVSSNLQDMAVVQDKIRRVSMDLGGAVDSVMLAASTSRLSHVRSLVIFGGTMWIPPLVEFRFLRMLFLEVLRREMGIDLTRINQLPQLRYLKIYCKPWFPDVSIVLPNKIQSMRQLETFEIHYTSCCNIPSDIVDLPQLSHIVLPRATSLPDGIGKAKSLCTLEGFNLQKSTFENIKSLGELTNLTHLQFYCSWQSLECMSAENSERWMAALRSSLQKLNNLKQLSTVSSFAYCGDAIGSSMFSPPFINIERLELTGLTFSRVPRWIGALHSLQCLVLRLKRVIPKSACTCREEDVGSMSKSLTCTCREEDVGIIGSLSSLMKLRLQIPGIPRERIIIGSTGFLALRDFGFDCDGISNLSFEAGAMPNLKVLWLTLDAHVWDMVTPAGIQHLSGLKKIYVLAARGDNDKMSEIARLNSSFQEFVNALPSRPAFHTGNNYSRPKKEME